MGYGLVYFHEHVEKPVCPVIHFHDLSVVLVEGQSNSSEELHFVKTLGAFVCDIGDSDGISDACATSGDEIWDSGDQGYHLPSVVDRLLLTGLSMDLGDVETDEWDFGAVERDLFVGCVVTEHPQIRIRHDVDKPVSCDLSVHAVNKRREGSLHMPRRVGGPAPPV